MASDTNQQRAVDRRWAQPGSAHDRLIKWAKIALPIAAGLLLIILALAPLDRKGDVSFILDKKKVQSAPERMRVEEARYTGTDDKGQLFEIVANRAIQPSSNTPLVDIDGMSARLNLQQGPMLIAADQGRYNIDTQQVAVVGPINVRGADGWQLQTRDVNIDLKNRQLASQGPAEGKMRLGQFRANHIRADLGSHTVVLDGGARLKIVQGTVR
ncbi:MAG: LPS export ABC transporter periplasmic protein LptC [Pseudomonadota bacterium]